MTRYLILAAALCVGACSERADDVPTVENAAPAAVGNTAVAVDDPLKRPKPKPVGTALTELPQPMLGRWGLVPADCEPGRADAKGLMTVEPKRFVFYESRGVPEAIVETAPGAVSADVAFTGEGQEWRKTVRLSVRDDVLVQEEDDPQLSFTYRRCPA
jgi:hypothetical protein